VTECDQGLNDKNAGLRVTPLQYTIQRGEQADTATTTVSRGNAFELKVTETESNRTSITLL
jgi:type III restriction enzyme